jgi:hypothetical protein
MEVMQFRSFADVLALAVEKPSTNDQHKSRHYSETLSKGLAHWLRDLVAKDSLYHSVLTPEAKVATVYGGKSLDVAALDERGYLLLDLSIKTFNFKDRKTLNYRHNYTGRFYELLGEELDLRRSYHWATLVALIFLPIDSCNDSTPSSFAHAVRQFSKVAPDPIHSEGSACFEHVFIALHSPNGDISFFDATVPPPRTGQPAADHQLSTDAMLEMIRGTVIGRASKIATAALPIKRPMIWGDY